jgi:hypothetical protein
MNTRNAYTASAMTSSLTVAIVNDQGSYIPSSRPVLQRRPGRLTSLGFGRTTELGLMAANATIWTWVAALPIGLV